MHLLIFGIKKVITDINIMQYFIVDIKAWPLSGLFNSFGVCCFLNADEIFCAFYCKGERMHYQFVYDVSKWATSQEISSYKIDNCTLKNFP